MDSIKVLLLSEIFYPELGSGANRISNLAKILKEKGYEVSVVTSYPNYPKREIYESEEFKWREKEKKIFDGITIHRIKPSKVKMNSNFFNRLYIYIIFLLKSIVKVLTLKGKYEVVIATTPSVFIGVLGIVAKLKFRCKFILDIRDLWPECLKGIGVFKNVKGALELGYFLEKTILRFTDSVVINSNAFREYLLNRGYKKKIEFVPNGLSEKEFKINSSDYEIENKDEFIIIYTGMIGLPQNIRTLVKAANLLSDYEDIKFKFIGTGIQVGRVKELIEYYNLKNVQLIEPMPKEKVLLEVKKSSVAILNLRGDSEFGLVMPGKIVDYMSVKKPIIAGVEGYTKNIIEKASCGKVVAPDDYKEMAKEIKGLYKNRKLLKVYGENGNSYCEENFIWEENIIRLDHLIKTTLGREVDEESMHVRMESLHQ